MSALDTVVVGAGTAGCVVATRLVERGRRVLLLEAGEDRLGRACEPPPLGQAPARCMHPLRAMTGLPGHAVTVLSGRGVGGTSHIQGGVALRGPREDYEQWGRLAGESWGWRAALDGFRTIENDVDVSDAWHGRGGPITIRRAGLEERQPLHRAFVEACGELDLGWSDDLNAPTARGAGLVPFSPATSRSVACSYLARVRDDARLVVSARTTATRLVFAHGALSGIELSIAGRPSAIRAEHAVICAGAIGTATLLLRSGIGPAQELERLGIDVTCALPGVGAQVHDHPVVWIEFDIERGRGRPGRPWLQVMLRGLPSGSDVPEVALEAFHDFRCRPAAHAHARGVLTCGVLNARGRGRVTLEPRTLRPRIVLDLAHPDDVRSLSRAVRLATRLMACHPLAQLRPSPVRLRTTVGHGGRSVAGTPKLFSPHTVRDALSAKTEAGLNALVGACAVTAHHLHGTCPMGDADSTSAVVSPELALHGIEGVSIVDASVMPVQLRANTSLTTVLVAERWAQIATRPAS